VPQVEVRFRNLTVSTEVHVGRRALPTLVNYVHDVAEVLHTLTHHARFLWFMCCLVGRRGAGYWVKLADLIDRTCFM